jgi:predicted AAA+ superfamily ATPase
MLLITPCRRWRLGFPGAIRHPRAIDVKSPVLAAALQQPTVHRYTNLLETSYLLVRLSAYAVNRTKRLIKAPKLYWGDTGLALHLSRT